MGLEITSYTDSGLELLEEAILVIFVGEPPG
jgi:hypothetical protein